MKTLIIMGAGAIGRTVLKEILPFTANIYTDIFFFDNNKLLADKAVEGRKVLAKNDMLDMVNSTETEIIIATDHWKELYEQCKLLGLQDKVVQIINKKIIENVMHYNKSLAQDGEDLYLQAYFADQKAGFYVDIGAHHPLRFSNTAWAYQKGWHGINVEPNEQQIEIFEKLRKRDKNLLLGCAEKEGILKYYKYEEPALNNFDADVYKDLAPVEICNVRVKTLAGILEEQNVEKIDLLSIDVEGGELGILRSNDWTRWKPDVVVVEQFGEFVEEIINSEIYKLMTDNGYKLGCRTRLNSIYIRQINAGRR